MAIAQENKVVIVYSVFFSGYSILCSWVASSWIRALHSKVEGALNSSHHKTSNLAFKMKPISHIHYCKLPFSFYWVKIWEFPEDIVDLNRKHISSSGGSLSSKWYSDVEIPTAFSQPYSREGKILFLFFISSKKLQSRVEFLFT